MIKVSTTGMAVSSITDLRFPIPGQQGHGRRIIHISLNNYNRLTNPYEYTTSTPSDSTKWITVKGGKLSFTQKKPFSGTIYIRQKGVNENKVKHIEMKMPSNYIAVSYDATSQQWILQ